jgi:hypothetical protein
MARTIQAKSPIDKSFLHFINRIFQFKLNSHLYAQQISDSEQNHHQQAQNVEN